MDKRELLVLSFRVGLSYSLDRLGMVGYSGMEGETRIGYRHGYDCGEEILAEQKRALEMSVLRASLPRSCTPNE